MKKTVLFLMLMASMTAVMAQNCREIVLPFFNNDTTRLNAYPQMKLDYRCHYSMESFYESDTIPTGAYVYGIDEVTDVFTGEHLSQDYVVDLEHLSIYRYSFQQFQRAFRETDKVLCFRTPSSTKPYLVVRSIQETLERAEAAVRLQYDW